MIQILKNKNLLCCILTSLSLKEQCRLTCVCVAWSQETTTSLERMESKYLLQEPLHIRRKRWPRVSRWMSVAHRSFLISRTGNGDFTKGIAFKTPLFSPETLRLAIQQSIVLNYELNFMLNVAIAWNKDNAHIRVLLECGANPTSLSLGAMSAIERAVLHDRSVSFLDLIHCLKRKKKDVVKS
jgi:hypothetical protein